MLVRRWITYIEQVGISELIIEHGSILAYLLEQGVSADVAEQVDYHFSGY